MSNPDGRIQGDESPDELISLEPSRADVYRETLEKEDKSDGMLQEWKLPKIPTNKVYKIRRFPWQAKANTIIDVAEAMIKVEGKKDFKVAIQLFDEQKLRSLRWQNYNFVHLGLVQIGIIPLFGKGLDVPVFCALCDPRCIEFSYGLLGGMHTNLLNGPTWCKVTPNFTLSLEDGCVKNPLTIRVQTKGLTDLMRGCKNLAITYRVMYRVKKSVFGPTNPVALKTTRSTEVFEPEPGTVLKFSGRQVDPKELQWPRSWVKNVSLPIYEEEPESSKTILENCTTVANWKSKIDSGSTSKEKLLEQEE